MSKKFSEVITVEACSAHGVLCAKQWYNIANGAGFTSSAFEKGKSYSVSGFISGKGNKYIDAMAPAVPGQAPLPAPAPATAPAAPPPPVPAASAPAASSAPSSDTPTKYGRPISPFEVKEGVRIGVQGIVQAVVASPVIPALLSDTDTFAAVVERESRKLLGLCDTLTDERFGK